jgi:hypothetical protein
MRSQCACGGRVWPLHAPFRFDVRLMRAPAMNRAAAAAGSPGNAGVPGNTGERA